MSYSAEALQQLERAVTGSVLTAASADYETTRRGWDLSINHHPAVIVVEEGGRVWYNSRAPSSIGLPAPVSRLIEGCLHGDEGSGQESSDGKDDPVRGARLRGRGARAGAVAR